MSKRELTQLCSQETGYTQKEISLIINWLLSKIQTELAENNEVNINGLGKFKVVNKVSKKHIHPQYGHVCAPKEYKTIKYVPSSSMIAVI